MPIEKIRDGLYVKKSFDGYRVVHPWENENGTINWFNVFTGGSYWNLIKLLVILAIIFGMVYSYVHDIGNCINLQNNICSYLPNISAYCLEQRIYYPTINFNITNKT